LQCLGSTEFPKLDLKLGHVGATTMNNHKGTVKFSELVKGWTGGNANILVTFVPSLAMWLPNPLMRTK